MEYQYIVNPATNRKCRVDSVQGRKIVNNYIMMQEAGFLKLSDVKNFASKAQKAAKKGVETAKKGVASASVAAKKGVESAKRSADRVRRASSGVRENIKARMNKE